LVAVIVKCCDLKTYTIEMNLIGINLFRFLLSY
jgi:hypothetical protein